jgi:hypothetical protein
MLPVHAPPLVELVELDEDELVVVAPELDELAVVAVDDPPAPDDPEDAALDDEDAPVPALPDEAPLVAPPWSVLTTLLPHARATKARGARRAVDRSEEARMLRGISRGARPRPSRRQSLPCARRVARAGQ